MGYSCIAAHGASHGALRGRGGGVEDQRLVGERHRGDVLPCRELAAGVQDAGHVGGGQGADLRLPREGEVAPPRVTAQRCDQLRQLRPAAAQVDPSRQQLPLGQVGDHQPDAAQPHGSILAERRVERLAFDRLRKVALRPGGHLERLGS